MKIRSLTAVVGLGFASCSSVFAQESSLVIYGIVDAGVRHVKSSEGPSSTVFANGGQSATRLGFRGYENIGNGLGAGFNIEQGFNTGTGATASSTNFWDRRATVSLLGQNWGELRLGRDYVPTFTSYMLADPFIYLNIAGTSNLVASTTIGPIRAAFGTTPPGTAPNVNTTVRMNGAVQYFLPGNLGGLEGSLLWAPNGDQKGFGGGLGYTVGPFTVKGAITMTRTNYNNGAAGPTVSDWFRDAVLSASYNFSPFKVMAAVREFRAYGLRQRNLVLSGTWNVGTGQFRIMAQHASRSGFLNGVDSSGDGGNQFSVGYVYNLSKRTSLFVQGSRINNSGKSRFMLQPGNVPAPLKDGAHLTGVESGIHIVF
jgi:predicted porin